ncbi:hypothetical protein HQN64_23930 [Enterobacteriaceae bacterium BIT-l23]|uniref:hypothetical protein n=1 Tax=Jejubacter sp. L23 TaxID=3092086 RepID=UPI001584F0B7|nr:hypothetical protein [Enterobacteriaceae bacterium BIT-l23]
MTTKNIIDDGLLIFEYADFNNPDTPLDQKERTYIFDQNNTGNSWDISTSGMQETICGYKSRGARDDKDWQNTLPHSNAIRLSASFDNGPGMIKQNVVFTRPGKATLFLFSRSDFYTPDLNVRECTMVVKLGETSPNHEITCGQNWEKQSIGFDGVDIPQGSPFKTVPLQFSCGINVIDENAPTLRNIDMFFDHAPVAQLMPATKKAINYRPKQQIAAQKFEVTDDEGDLLPGAWVEFTLSPDINGVQFTNGTDSASFQCNEQAVVTLPAGTLEADDNVTGELKLSVAGDEALSIGFTKQEQTRIIITPEPSTNDLKAPVEGFFNPNTGFEAQLQVLVGNDWRPKADGSIQATILNGDQGTPHFCDADHPYDFAEQMAGTDPVALPLVQAGVHPGKFSLNISDADNPDVCKTLALEVVRIDSFEDLEPIGNHDSVSRNWVTENGRWRARALLSDNTPAASQPVSFSLDDSDAPGVAFSEAGGTYQSGTTDDYGYAHIPAISVPDIAGHFTVYIEAGDDSVHLSPAQCHMDVSICEAPYVATVERAGWKDKDTIDINSPRAFSVQLKDSNNKFITSGKYVEFKILNNTAGARFSEPTNIITGHVDKDTDTVPACLGVIGTGLVTCRTIECDTYDGAFTLRVGIKGDSTPYTQGVITVSSD